MTILDSTTELVVIARLYRLLLKTHLIVNNFPKQEKYVLGQRIESTLMDCISCACLAAQEQKGFKARPLLQALAQADLTKILFRMVHELGLMTTPQYQRLGTE